MHPGDVLDQSVQQAVSRDRGAPRKRDLPAATSWSPDHFHAGRLDLLDVDRALGIDALASVTDELAYPLRWCLLDLLGARTTDELPIAAARRTRGTDQALEE